MRLLISRLAGHGDLVMLEPVIEALYYQWRRQGHDVHVTVRVHPDYQDSIRHHPLVDDVLLSDNRYADGYFYPGQAVMNLGEQLAPSQRRFDVVYELQGVIERNSGNHGIDAFAGPVGARLLRRTPTFYLDPQYEIEEGYGVLFCHRSAEEERALTPGILKSVGWDNYDLPPPPEESASIQELAWRIKKSRLVVSVDSAAAHIATALNVPCIGIYADRFPWAIRGQPGMQWVSKKELDQLPGMIEAELATPFVDERYLNSGDGSKHFGGFAMEYLRGKYLDIGASRWPLSGAIACDQGNRERLLDSAPDRAYDGLYSSHCLEHIADWKAELNLWARVTKPGGFLFLYLPHPDFAPWHPGGAWVGAQHVWKPIPHELVHYMETETDWEVVQYSSRMDRMKSFWIMAKKKPRQRSAGPARERAFGDGVHDPDKLMG